MESKILAIGDPHFKVDNLPLMRIFEQRVIDVINEYRPTTVVILGDILDRFKTAHIGVQTEAVDFLIKVHSTNVQLVILIGNHDRINNEEFLTKVSPFRACKLWSNTILCDDKARSFYDSRYTFVGVPYVSPGRFNEAIKEFDPKEIKGYFSHQEYRNSRLGIKRSVVGDVWPMDYPVNISGHIHDYEQLQPNLIHVGSPRVEDTVSLYTFNDNGYNEQRIKLNLPKKIKLNLSVAEYLKYQFSIEDSGEYRIKVIGTASELSGVQGLNITKYLRDKINVKLTFDPIIQTYIPSGQSVESKYRSFKECLEERLKNRIDLITLYNRL